MSDFGGIEFGARMALILVGRTIRAISCDGKTLDMLLDDGTLVSVPIGGEITVSNREASK